MLSPAVDQRSEVSQLTIRLAAASFKLAESIDPLMTREAIKCLAKVISSFISHEAEAIASRGSALKDDQISEIVQNILQSIQGPHSKAFLSRKSLQLVIDELETVKLSWSKSACNDLAWRKILLITPVLKHLRISVQTQTDRLEEGFSEVSDKGRSICEYLLQINYSNISSIYALL